MNYQFLLIGFVFIFNYYLVFCEISQQKKLIESNDLNNELNDRLLAHIRDKRENINQVHIHVHINNGNDDKDLDRDSNEKDVNEDIDDKKERKKKNKKKRKKNRKCVENDKRKRCQNRATTTPSTTSSNFTALPTTTTPYTSNPSTYYFHSTNDYQMISSQSSFPTDYYSPSSLVMDGSTYMSDPTAVMMPSTQSPEEVKDIDKSVAGSKDINYRKQKKAQNDDKYVVKDI